MTAVRGDNWIPVDRAPALAGIRPDETVLVWHTYHGALAERADRTRANRYYTHWQEIGDGWIATARRLPGPDDADEFNCVLAMDTLGETRVAGWHRIVEYGEFLCWQRLPDPPQRYREMRRHQ